jgi:hypothetical protein
MKNKKLHVFSIILIFAMLILAVSTSRPPPKVIKNSLSYEVREEYFFIKIRPNRNPNSYGDYRKGYDTSFTLYYEDIEERQYFYYAQGKFIIRMIDNENNIIEEIVWDHLPFEVYIDGRYFIIKIKNEFLKYRDHSINSVYFSAWHGASIYEIYFK